MITLLWPNASVTTGETWRDVEDAVRSSQWSPYKTRHEFREEMRRRAYVWSGAKVGLKVTSEGFMRSLGDAEMFIIIEEED